LITVFLVRNGVCQNLLITGNGRAKIFNNIFSIEKKGKKNKKNKINSLMGSTKFDKNFTIKLKKFD